MKQIPDSHHCLKILTDLGQCGFCAVGGLFLLLSPISSSTSFAFLYRISVSKPCISLALLCVISLLLLQSLLFEEMTLAGVLIGGRRGIPLTKRGGPLRVPLGPPLPFTWAAIYNHNKIKEKNLTFLTQVKTRTHYYGIKQNTMSKTI